MRSDYFANYKHVAHRFAEAGAPAEAGCAAITHSDMQIAHYGRDGCILRPRRAAQGLFSGDGFRHRWRIRTQRSHPTAHRPRHRGSELRRKVAQRTSNGRIGEAAEPHRRQARPITEDIQRSFQDFADRARRAHPEAFAHKDLHTRQGYSALSYRLRGRHTVAGASSAAICKYRYVITEDSAPTRGRRRHSR